MRTIVVIPAYKEARRVYQVVHSVVSLGYDVVVVDDGSIDNTAEEAFRGGAKVLRHLVNRGYGAALTTGNQWALCQVCDVIVHFDADGQHDANDTKRMILPIINRQADVVLGSRFLKNNEGIPLIRRILIKLAILFTWVFSGVRLTDAHNGFRAFSSRALRDIDCWRDDMSYASEVIDQIAKLGLRYREVAVTIRYSEYSRRKGMRNFRKIILGLKFLWGKMSRE